MKAVVFDLDNTLNDFVKMKESSVWAAVKAMKKAGLKLSEQQTFDKLFEIYNANGWEDQTAFQKLLEQTLGQVDYKILAHGIIAYRKDANFIYNRIAEGRVTELIKTMRELFCQMA